MQTKAPPYRLHYWPFLQGRGEFVRLVLEYAELPYIDVARDPRSHATQAPEPNQGGVAELAALFRGETANNGERFPVFAPPILELENKQLISQVANILLFLGRRHGLLEDEPLAIAHANQLQLTIADIVAEIHDTHHPVSATLHYEDQKQEAIKAAKLFREQRIPRYFDFFCGAIKCTAGPFVFGEEPSYVDLSLFQLLAGLRYAFPKHLDGLGGQYEMLHELHDRVAGLPTIAAYLDSPRRIPFNEDGIFRRYPELDA
jgi:glutathione S-transferase